MGGYARTCTVGVRICWRRCVAAYCGPSKETYSRERASFYRNKTIPVDLRRPHMTGACGFVLKCVLSPLLMLTAAVATPGLAPLIV